MLILINTSAEWILRPSTKETKIHIIVEHLQDWWWSFTQLYIKWLGHNSGKKQGYKKRKAGELISTLITDNDVQSVIKKADKVHPLLISCIISIIYKKFHNLYKNTIIFGL